MRKQIVNGVLIALIVASLAAVAHAIGIGQERQGFAPFILFVLAIVGLFANNPERIGNG